MNIYREYVHISLCLCLPDKFSNENYIRVEKKKLLKKITKKNIIQVFVKNLQILPLWRILLHKFWNSRTILIPICTEVDSANLFLFLFAWKITIRWSLVHTLLYPASVPTLPSRRGKKPIFQHLASVAPYRRPALHSQLLSSPNNPVNISFCLSKHKSLSC